MKKTKLYLVGNAHLDPIWQWRWQEGSAEAKATIRSALDRMNEFPDFKFVCSSASVYQWIEEFAPQMFEEVKKRVQEGRFVIVGGWHVQPDCNLPSGEGFARQSLYSQRYFKEHLGATAEIGYNVDSFGHNLMLPQILQKSGMHSYIFMRPCPGEKPMERDLFHWVSPDGSSVLTYRILDPYCFNFETEEALQERLDYLEANTKTDVDILPFFYGVGNHGGGPTIRNLEILHEYEQKHPECMLIYSNLADCFEAIRSSRADIPEHHDDLQHHASGCYSTVFHLKNGIRRSEKELLAAESFSSLAYALCGKKERPEKMKEAWERICFLHFHDSMGGCSTKKAHDDAYGFYGYARQIAAEVENNALQTISWAIDTSDSSKGIPFIVFNPNGFEVEETVHVNGQCAAITDSNGAVVPSQWVRSESLECYCRSDTIFRAKVPALGYAIYYLQGFIRAQVGKYNKAEVAAHNAQSPVKAIGCTGNITGDNVSVTVLENEDLRLEIELYTGYILSCTDKQTGEQWFSDKAAVPVVVDEYYHDAWSHGKNFFTDVMARFSDATVTVIENGPVRATVKVVSRYNNSTLTQYFSLESGRKNLSVKAQIDWHEKHKMLKIAWPMNVENPTAYYEIPYGVIARPADGEEEPGQTWTAVKGDCGGYALLNNNTYSSSVNGNTIFHTVTRGHAYADHGGPRNSETLYSNQGVFDFSYELMEVEESWAPVIRASHQINKPVTSVVENWHKGNIMDPVFTGIQISADNVILSACKRSEDDTGRVIRLYEVDGKETEVIVSGALFPVSLKAAFTPYSVNTYYLPDGSDEWQEVMLTEYPAEQ